MQTAKLLTDEAVLHELIVCFREGYAPTTTDLAAYLDRDRTTIWRAINRLELAGKVKVNCRGRGPRAIFVRPIICAEMEPDR